MDIKKLVDSLHLLERAVLPYLDRPRTLKELEEKTDLKQVEIMRALQWLQNKKIITIKEETKEIVELDENGKEYAKKGLPETRFLKILKDNFEEISNVMKKVGLNKDELNVCIGTWKKKGAISINKEKDKLMVKITDFGKKLLKKPNYEELFLQSKFPLDKSTLKPEERYAFDLLSKRKQILKTSIVKTKIAKLTDLGKRINIKEIDKDVVDRLTPEMLRKQTWKNKKFRRYDVSINVPKINRGKRHFVNQAIDYVRKIWLEFGFKEMTGPLLQTSFWNFDALFTAQDHPVRDMHDTFYIKNPEKGRLPDPKIVKKVKCMHEHGGTINSKGWQYSWDQEEAKKNVLRTHTTVLSAKTLATLKKTDLPAKFFAIGKCFRNETVDWAHLFEFNQVEGIVVDPNANFRNHIGYLREYFKKMGYPKARFRPAYFPYTEMSMEIEVFHPIHKQWIELGGSGIFRPEVVEPLLGEAIPVLAWGPGFDRTIMEYYNITDMRDLYKNDLKQLRNMKEWMP